MSQVGKLAKFEKMSTYKIEVVNSAKTSLRTFKTFPLNSIDELKEVIVSHYSDLNDHYLEFYYKDTLGVKIDIIIDADLRIMAQQSVNTIRVINKGHMSDFFNLDWEQEQAEYKKHTDELMGFSF